MGKSHVINSNQIEAMFKILADTNEGLTGAEIGHDREGTQI